MKRFSLTVTLVMVLATFAVAGDYHFGTSLVCSDCHVMHASQSHGYNADGTGIITPFDATPHEYLLRNDVNDLCLSCHDNQPFAPDVYGPNANGYVRAAGALNRVGDATTATGHTLDATDYAPGSNPPWNNPDGLECVDCHQPHGYNPNGNAYRNLIYDPGNVSYPGLIVTYSTGTNDLGTDVYQVASGPLSTHYAWDNVFFNEPDQTASAIADYCKGCHTDFHGAKGGPEVGGSTGEGWLRHPAADADIGAVGGGHSSLAVFAGHTNRVKVMSPTGVWDGSDAGSTPTCLTCHKAHGNNNPFGLIFMAGTGTVTEEGDDGAQVRDLCKQCHVQG